MLLDFGIVGLFVAYSVGSGFRFRRQASRGLEDYFLAGRSLPGWKAGFSMAATQYAADTPLLVTGLIATAGIFSLWRLWVYAIAFLVMGFALGASWRRSGILTDAELTELRYGGPAAAWLRALKAIHLGTFINCTVLAMVLIAAARIAEPFLEWHRVLPAGIMEPLTGFMRWAGFSLTTLPEGHPEAWIYSANNLLSISAIVAFVWLYSATGGLRSVVATDVIQLSLALVSTALYALFITRRAGGLPDLLEGLRSLYGAAAAGGLLAFGPPDWSGATALFCGVLAVQWFAQVNADGTGYLAQRTMACRSDRDARSAAVVFVFLQILLRSLLWLVIGAGLLVLYPAAALPPPGTASEEFQLGREATFAWGIRDFLPAGVRGLMLTGLLAALASTVDTHLNWGASYWANDLYRRFLAEGWQKRTPGQRELVWVARLSTLGILILALGIGMRLRSIQAAWHLSLLFGSGIGAVLLLRWFWYRINVYSEISAGAASLALSPVLLFGFPEMSEEARLLWMTGLSTGTMLAVTLLTRPEPEPVLREFYRRARPPGFWGPVARGLGEDPAGPRRDFTRAMGAVAAATGSLFSLLVGAGLLLTRAPGDRGTAPFLLIGLGAAAVPFWLRWGRLAGPRDGPGTTPPSGSSASA